MTLTSSDRESEKLSTEEASILSVPSGASSAGAVPRPSKSKLTSGTTGGSDVRPKNRIIRIIAMTSTTAIGTVIAMIFFFLVIYPPFFAENFVLRRVHYKSKPSVRSNIFYRIVCLIINVLSRNVRYRVKFG